jgi:predicted nuclease with TOPRIM domain
MPCEAENEDAKNVAAGGAGSIAAENEKLKESNARLVAELRAARECMKGWEASCARLADKEIVLEAENARLKKDREELQSINKGLSQYVAELRCRLSTGNADS